MGDSWHFVCSCALEETGRILLHVEGRTVRLRGQRERPGRHGPRHLQMYMSPYFLIRQQGWCDELVAGKMRSTGLLREVCAGTQQHKPL